MGNKFFNTDRLKKYGYGVPRLVLLAWAAFAFAPKLHNVQPLEEYEISAYASSWRWAVHMYVGSIGAVVNVQRFGLIGNLAILAGAAALIGWDATTFDVTMLVVLMKTMGGDFFAGKLDTAEWKLVLLFTFAVFLPLACVLPQGGLQGVEGAGFMLPSGAATLIQEYVAIFPFLFGIQLLCEYGDAKWERFSFFRYRYSFESLNAALLFAGPALQTYLSEGGALRAWGYFMWEARPACDGVPRLPEQLYTIGSVLEMMVCLGYRVSNLMLIVANSGLVTELYEQRMFVYTFLQRAAFRLYGAYYGMRMIYVSDVEVAVAVLKASASKGDCLERHIASPAWAPVISLESVDGPLYERMMRDFHHFMAQHCPPPAKMAECARRHVGALKDSGKRIDASAVVQLTLEVIIDFLFDRKWEPSFQALSQVPDILGAHGEGGLGERRRGCPRGLASTPERRWHPEGGLDEALSPSI
ncbi:hypothetical protein CYMTET_49660 [Cymbomonas tetramitiformis]|uniref:Uncharacterized protein n=1 Tax=Cymbomonas tetramitiformis TaxID=36881 RepID=A0AAE0EUH3_9CHLO|nr:hypothetical protein CYMTET_49660 [Cymbomonas tetramitiformis]